MCCGIDACVVDNAGDRAKCLVGFCIQADDVGLFAHVGLHGNGLAAQRLDFGNNAFGQGF